MEYTETWQQIYFFYIVPDGVALILLVAWAACTKTFWEYNNLWR